MWLRLGSFVGGWDEWEGGMIVGGDVDILRGDGGKERCSFLLVEKGMNVADDLVVVPVCTWRLDQYA